MTTKKVIKKETKKQDSIEQFLSLATDLKETILDLNNRVASMESILNRLKGRMGL